MKISKRSRVRCWKLISIALCLPVVLQAQVSWFDEDVGSSFPAGVASEAGGVYTITNAGAGVGGNTDAFKFLYQHGRGDFQIVTKIDGISGGSGGQTGLMIRCLPVSGLPNESNPAPDPSAANAYVHYSVGDGLVFSARSEFGGETEITPGPEVVLPVWIKLTKVGNHVVAHYSSNSTNRANWTELGEIVLPEAQGYYSGVAVAGGPSLSTAQGVFSSLSLIGNLPHSMQDLALWLSADDGVTFSTSPKVSFWADQSRAGNNAVQGNSTFQPSWVPSQINGRPILRFTRSTPTGFIVPYHPSLSAGNFTLFGVGKHTLNSTGSMFYRRLTTTINDYGLQFDGTAARPAVSYRGIKAIIPTYAFGTYGIFAGTYDRDNLRLWVNGSLAAMTSLNTPEGNLATSPIVINDLNYTSVIIGGFDNSSVALNGDIAELLFFNRLLSDTERKSVESYLYQKYLLGAPPVTEAPVLKISSPPPGIYPAPQTIFLEADESAIVYYTIDGSDPTDESLIYRDSIGVQIPSPVPPDSSRTTTLKFRSYKYGHLPSPVTTLVYTVDQHTTFDRNGLRVWLRSDKVVSSNSSVSQWIDLSGNNNNANQANVSQRPIVVSNQINGNPAIRFDGIDDFLLVPKNASIEPSQLTLVVVSRHTGNGSLQGSFVAKGLSYGIARNNTSTGIAAYINSNTTGLANWSAPEV